MTCLPQACTQARCPLVGASASSRCHRWTPTFEKLLAYSKVSIFVHVTYSFRDAPLAEMFDAVERVARDPDGADYAIDRRFDAESARPAGIYGRYWRDGEFITVFFVVIDMRLAGLRRAVSAPQISV